MRKQSSGNSRPIHCCKRWQAFTKSVMLDRISLDTQDCTESSLKQHVSNLRRKLRDVGGEDTIESVWGIGFRLAEKS